MKFLRNNIEIIISLFACFFIFITLVYCYEDKIKELKDNNKKIEEAYYLNTNNIKFKVNSFINNDITEIIIDKDTYYVKLPRTLYNLELNKEYNLTFKTKEKILIGDYSRIINNDKIEKVVEVSEKN